MWKYYLIYLVEPDTNNPILLKNSNMFFQSPKKVVKLALREKFTALRWISLF